MARPRVFISSTFYDLRHIRADIEAFVGDLGYDAVANERGEIAYGSDKALEEYCYKEIETCDIVIAIVGGRFGSESSRSGHSISQMEVKQAVDLGRQLYVFVEADVLAELRTYKLNTQNKDVKYAHADDVRIFEFLEEIERLKQNNSMFPFKESADIMAVLREQWAGLFQRMLRAAARQEEVRVIDSLKSTAQSLDELVKYLTSQTKRDDKVVAEILLPSHPIFMSLAKRLDVPYRVYFQNLEEMTRWLSQRGYKEHPADFDSEWHSYVRVDTDFSRSKSGGTQRQETTRTLRVSASLFSSTGDLKVLANRSWNEDLIELDVKRTKTPVKAPDFDDEIPF